MRELWLLLPPCGLVLAALQGAGDERLHLEAGGGRRSRRLCFQLRQHEAAADGRTQTKRLCLFFCLGCRSTWPPAALPTSPAAPGSPPLERSSQTMSVTSVAFSLSAEEDCLLLPSTPPRPWGPEERRRSSVHSKQAQPPWFAPESVDQRASTLASPLFSAPPETSADSSSDCSTTEAPSDVEAEADAIFLCEAEEPQAETRPFFPAEGAPRLLLGAWCSSRSPAAAAPSSLHQSGYQPVATKHHLLAV